MSDATSIKKYMTSSIIKLSADMDIIDASALLVKHGISGAPVIDDTGQLIGILTERDCFKITLNASYYSEPGGKVSEYMSHTVDTVKLELSVFELAELFIQKKFRRYPVVSDSNKLLGIISRRDTLKALLDINKRR